MPCCLTPPMSALLPLGASSDVCFCLFVVRALLALLLLSFPDFNFGKVAISMLDILLGFKRITSVFYDCYFSFLLF